MAHVWGDPTDRILQHVIAFGKKLSPSPTQRKELLQMVTGMREVPDDVFRSCEKARVGEVLQDEQRAAAALIFWAALITLLRSLLSAFELPAHHTGMLSVAALKNITSIFCWLFFLSSLREWIEYQAFFTARERSWVLPFLKSRMFFFFFCVQYEIIKPSQ